MLFKPSFALYVVADHPTSGHVVLLICNRIAAVSRFHDLLCCSQRPGILWISRFAEALLELERTLPLARWASSLELRTNLSCQE